MRIIESTGGEISRPIVAGAYGSDVKVAPMMAVLNYRRDVVRILKWGCDLGGGCLRRQKGVKWCLFEFRFGSIFRGFWMEILMKSEMFVIVDVFCEIIFWMKCVFLSRVLRPSFELREINICCVFTTNI